MTKEGAWGLGEEVDREVVIGWERQWQRRWCQRADGSRGRETLRGRGLGWTGLQELLLRFCRG